MKRLNYITASALIAFMLISLSIPHNVRGQETEDKSRDLFPTSTRCADSGTACWTDNDWFSGIRIAADLDLGFIFQNGENTFENTISSLSKISLEFNIYKGWVALQTGIYAPGKITLDEQSPLVSVLADSSREVGYKYGLLGGLTFLNGSLATGYGFFSYDRRYFNTTPEGGDGKDSFLYVALQPISSIRASFQEAKEN